MIGGGDGNRAEADRWLVTSEKLLASGDLQGAKTFAIRACETDPTRAETADYILAISDTLLAGESRVGNTNLPDWYAVLRLVRLTHNLEFVASQYRRLALLLNPNTNRLPLADQAFRLVSDAWYVLSDPSRKALYDREMQLSQLGQFGFQHIQQPYQPPQQQQQQFSQSKTHQFQWQQPSKTPASARNSNQRVEEERPNLNNATESTRKTRSSQPAQTSRTSELDLPTEQTRPSQADTEPKVPSFWTSCPYCLVLYEYPKACEECTLRCQHCRRAFQAVTIQSPPVTGEGKDVYFCSWSFFPLGFSGHAKTVGWSPVSPMFACPIRNGERYPTKMTGKNSASPRIYYDEDDVYVEISESTGEDHEDDDWHCDENRGNKKTKLGKGKESVAKSDRKHQSEKVGRGNQNVDNMGSASVSSGSIMLENMAVASSSGVAKPAGNSGRKRTGTGVKNLGRLDLNVEFSNEVEEPAVARGRNEGNLAGNRDVDNIEGIGFFEGLDEFLSSLPILSVVADDKVKAT